MNLKVLAPFRGEGDKLTEYDSGLLLHIPSGCPGVLLLGSKRRGADPSGRGTSFDMRTQKGRPLVGVTWAGDTGGKLSD